MTPAPNADPGRRPRRPLAVLLACGVGLLVTLGLASGLDARDDVAWLLTLLGGASACYLVARTRLDERGRPGWGLMACVVLAVVWRVALVSTMPLLSDDIYRYVWDGRVQHQGLDPYATAPADPALDHLHVEATRRIDPTNAALVTIYPPGAQLFFRAVTGVHESTIALAVAVVLCDLLIALVLWRWLLATDRSPWWVLAYLWHPLVAIEGAAGGHIDVVGTLLVVVTAWALATSRPRVAALALAGATAVKFLPVVLAPLLWRRIRVTDALAGTALFGALYVPFLGGGAGLPTGSLATYTEQWRFNGPVFGALEPWGGVTVTLGVAVLVGLGVACVARRRWPVESPEAWVWPLAATLVLLPAIYPWYLVWLTPFLITRSTRPLTAWTLLSLTTYAVWANERAGVGWVLPAWVEPLEYGVVAVAAVSLLWGRGSRASRVASNPNRAAPPSQDGGGASGPRARDRE